MLFVTATTPWLDLRSVYRWTRFLYNKGSSDVAWNILRIRLERSLRSSVHFSICRFLPAIHETPAVRC